MANSWNNYTIQNTSGNGLWGNPGAPITLSQPLGQPPAKRPVTTVPVTAPWATQNANDVVVNNPAPGQSPAVQAINAASPIDYSRLGLPQPASAYNGVAAPYNPYANVGPNSYPGYRGPGTIPPPYDPEYPDPFGPSGPGNPVAPDSAYGGPPGLSGLMGALTGAPPATGLPSLAAAPPVRRPAPGWSPGMTPNMNAQAQRQAAFRAGVPRSLGAGMFVNRGLNLDKAGR